MRIPDDIVTRIIEYLCQLADEMHEQTGQTPEQLSNDISDLKEIVDEQ